MCHHRSLLHYHVFCLVPSISSFVWAGRPPKTFHNTLPSFNTVHEALALCNVMWNIKSAQHGAKKLVNVNQTLSSNYFLKVTSSGTAAWVVTNNASGVIYVVFKAFNYADAREWIMVADAKLELLGVDKASYLLGAARSEMRGLDIKVHAGWNDAIFEKRDDQDGEPTIYEHLLVVMNSLLESIEYIYKTIICTINSQGGIMTTLFASYLVATDMDNRNIQVITFGAPSVGNKAYESYANGMKNLAIWKIQHQDDPLPFFGIYRQPGHSIRISPFDNGTVNFQVNCLQNDNATMGLAASPDSFSCIFFYTCFLFLLDK